LEAPLFRGDALDAVVEEQCTIHRRSRVRLQKLPSQSALNLLRSSFGVPRIGYLLRCSPCSGRHLLGTFDELQRTGLEAINNCSLNETQWLQASLPVRDGVWMSVGPRRRLHLTIWPQPRRPSTFRLLSSRDLQGRRQVMTSTGRRSWCSVKT